MHHAAGESSVALPAALPLPIYSMWASLFQQANRLGVHAIAKAAVLTLLDHFVLRTPPRPLWEAHPGDALTLKEPHARTASAPLLRAFAAAALEHAGRSVAALAAASGPQLNEVHVELQAQRLRLTQELIIAMQVSRCPPLLPSRSIASGNGLSV